MNPISPQDGERHEALHLSTAEKTDGFAAVMKRLKGRSEQERARLRAQADAAILGHEAYALGHENLRRNNYVAAKRWLRVAAEHGVPGAEQALEEIESGPAVEEPAHPATVEVTPDADLCATGASHAVPLDVEKWASLLHTWTQAGLAMDAARAEARQILDQARSTADELITTAREEADRARDEARDQIAADHRATAQLLCDAQQLQHEAKLLMQKARRAAEAPTGARKAWPVLIDDSPQHAQAIPFSLSGRPGGVRDERQQQSSALAMEGAMQHLLWTSSSVCTVQFGALAYFDEILKARARARDSLPERAGVEGGEAGRLRRHSVLTRQTEGLRRLWSAIFHNGSMRRGSEVRPLDDVDLVFSFATTVQLWPECRIATEAASTESFKNTARWLSAGNEVALATPDPDHQSNEAYLKILWVTDGCVEPRDDDTALEAISADETAPAAPR
ncbi:MULTISPECIES: hypothetical protein [Streptomyces]|uniref:Uncharacterized protein n=1 Tax=Streptomyces sviceus (strain ATCC 29083 / DSM 924 / JCM 4929 / NBRC 13980 / NCIMB 11184 / NRRL 5439 / UC 5370) TaxID=463191 RepID=B5HS58_STRX2|nr:MULTISPECIES: hypothetical protein [Streptomyces]EDY55663.1 conserved hypothetical protein [Streptomyces sviceus ATCC 29083]MYT03121.1 hypothetical protein [Streptomyces sp. SID5470]